MNKKISFLKSIMTILITPSFIVNCSSTGPSAGTGSNLMPYSQLKVMDLDEMTQLLQKKYQEYKRTDDPVPLQLGLQYCLSRPDEDGLVDKTISIVRSPLEDLELWESSVESLVDRSIETLKNNSFHSADQVTAGIILENIISEFKPAFTKQYQSPGFETKIIEKIARAEIELSRPAASERKLNLMRGPTSPSALAQNLLDHRNAMQKSNPLKK